MKAHRFDLSDRSTTRWRGKQMKRIVIVTLALYVTVSCAKKETPAATPSNATKAYTIAVIPQGSTHEFWKSIHAGAVKATQDLKQEGIEVNLIWKGPLREDDREQQIQVVEGFVSQGVNGIVLAPFDKDALVRPIQEAKRAGIPTVVVDSPLNSSDPIAVIATNNFH